MRVKIRKDGSIRMTATSKRDSLNLLKFLSSADGNNDPERQELIKRKEQECLELEKTKSSEPKID